MTPRRELIVNTLAGLALIALLAWVGPTLLDRSSEVYHEGQLEQDNLLQARADARSALRIERAARYICGPNAEPRWISNEELSCANNGAKARSVRLASADARTPTRRPASTANSVTAGVTGARALP